MNLIRCLFCLGLTVVSVACPAKLELSPLFGDGAVLQRDRPVRIWGRAEAGANVRAEFDGDAASTTVGSDGRWEVVLPAREAGGPFTLEIVSGDERRAVEDVFVGDVWICSGQSNMEWTVVQARNAEAEIKAAGDARLRHFKVPRSWARRPEPRLAGGGWEATTPDTVGDFTAVGYFFARELRARVDVPIGLINTSWGGSRIEAWMSAETLDVDRGSLDKRLDKLLAEQQALLDQSRENLARWNISGGGIVDGEAVWADPGLDDGDWASMRVPMLWEQAGFAGMDGFAWYRTTFELTAEEARKGVTLGLGKIDDSDRTWVNGREVGGMEQRYDVPREYPVAAKVLKAGLNTVAIRVEDTGGGGGIHGDPGLVFVQLPGQAPRPLAGEWKFKADPARVTLNADAQQHHTETLLYNKMIHPLQSYPIKGVIWYQGESNADDAESALQYRDQFANMIRDWREDWGQGDFPFLWVQLANYISNGDTDTRSPWAILRESQSAALALPNTAQAVTIDIGNPDDIHPRNKQDVGRRVALAALHHAYGKNGVVYSGPTLRGLHVDGDEAIVSFDHVGSGLAVRGGGELKGFTIAGPDGAFKPAEAEIDGNRVVVSRPDLSDPVAVRYAWSDNPESANLINAESLPASPFRTDGAGRPGD